MLPRCAFATATGMSPPPLPPLPPFLPAPAVPAAGAGTYMYQASPAIPRATTSQIHPVWLFFFGGSPEGGVTFGGVNGGCVDALIIYMSRLYKVALRSGKT